MKNKIVLVTGSTKGIGKAIAERYESNGYTVIRNGTSNTNYKHYIQADLSTKEGIYKVKDYILTKYKKLDILVNNAAWTKFVEHKDLDSLNENDIDKILNLNIKTPFILVKELFEFFNKESCIINIASVAGTTSQGSNVVYCASKAALISMTKSLARALGPIRVNSVSPGLTLTGFVTFPGDYIDETVNSTPLHKPGYPEDIAETVYQLTESLTHITGQDIVVDGGKILN